MRQYTRSPRYDSDNQSTGGLLPEPATSRQDCMSAAMKRYKYLRRIFKFQQMDFEFALWQMWYLFVSPQKVYRNFHYRKQTKKQFARDDPAFLLLLSAWLTISSIAFAIVLRLGIIQLIKFLVYVVLVDCIGCGIIVATLFWFFGNKYLRRDCNDLQDIEWGYAFDVHLNAFFPQFVMIHIWQLFFYNGIINHEWFISRFIGNSFWLVGICYYVYITFLGYNCLPFLHKTNLILSSVPVLVLFYIISIISGWNVSHTVMEFYHNRVK
ncbi:protein unc-50 homolog isoform X1 [Chrysoperla carnea]|uniref:protein unc-50 homolog isoform X1 n=1 Tax=Chrysoperla carnea TaxID=189513 RepID=UPI001D092505|nr:protein unc-50 homolog isoform X1 [Chrysoperla carnea]